ncbi:hypothetical protein QYZ88_007685 [Lachnospiraceae bacterium C1.1]|nr:hypothetical protein [Lachnospiraceae bacterium C1.1]
MVNQVLLNDTLQKINASLNKRFEQDADLYISKQDEYEIKKNLCNEAYGGVVDMAKAKGIKHDIIVKVILRNAGVLNVKDIGRFKRELSPVFEDANFNTLSYMMEDVLSGNIYMQKKVRHVLFLYYMSGVTAKTRIKYWKQDNFNFNLDERKELFRIIIEKTNHKDPSKTLKFKIDFIQDAFEKYPDLMKNDVFNYLKATLTSGEENEFFKYLIEEMQSPSIDKDAYKFILVDAYASYGEKAFNDAVSQIKSSSPENYKQYIKAIRKLLWSEKDKTTLIRMFDTLGKVYDSPYMKSHVKREIDKKLWKTAKSNKELYEERKEKIDYYMSGTEQTDTNKYSSFADITLDLHNEMIPKNISFYWVNMKSPEFEYSILESFTMLSVGDLASMSEVYRWLFEHSIPRKPKMRELIRMCERLANPLHEFSTLNKESAFYDTLDRLWVDYVVTYKLQGKMIEAYMFEKHFDRIKEWKGRS